MSIRADAGAMSRIRAFLSDFLREHRVGRDDQARIMVAVEELVTNLVKYGYPDAALPGSVEVSLRLDADRLGIEIADDGQAFDPLAQPAPDFEAPLDAQPVGRLGIHLARSLMEVMSYRRDAGRNVTTFGRRVAFDTEAQDGPG